MLRPRMLGVSQEANLETVYVQESALQSMLVEEGRKQDWTKELNDKPRHFHGQLLAESALQSCPSLH